MDTVQVVATSQATLAAAPFWSATTLGALLTLTLMEVVLGIDNIVFVAIQVGKLPRAQQNTGRVVGMSLALLMRLGLLSGITWVMGMTRPIFDFPIWVRGILYDNDKTGPSSRDLILIAGGLFLLYKASREIFDQMEPHGSEAANGGGKGKLGLVIVHLILLDLVFSLDSVITAVGMAQRLDVMVIAMLVAVGAMIVLAKTLTDFVQGHPSIKILALSFLNLIGVMLLLEGMGQHVNKGYIYSAMVFSLGVELLNMRYRKKKRPAATRLAEAGGE
ncbi:MAG: TerC family protein [Myxococcales bacterium]|nr:TerC family protein [Myxococcales bacterium]